VGLVVVDAFWGPLHFEAARSRLGPTSRVSVAATAATGAEAPAAEAMVAPAADSEGTEAAAGEADVAMDEEQANRVSPSTSPAQARRPVSAASSALPSIVSRISHALLGISTASARGHPLPRIPARVLLVRPQLMAPLAAPAPPPPQQQQQQQQSESRRPPQPPPGIVPFAAAATQAPWGTFRSAVEFQLEERPAPRLDAALSAAWEALGSASGSSPSSLPRPFRGVRALPLLRPASAAAASMPLYRSHLPLPLMKLLTGSVVVTRVGVYQDTQVRPPLRPAAGPLASVRARRPLVRLGQTAPPAAGGPAADDRRPVVMNVAPGTMLDGRPLRLRGDLLLVSSAVAESAADPAAVAPTPELQSNSPLSIFAIAANSVAPSAPLPSSSEIRDAAVVFLSI
jgi:hypothetical protein